MITVAAALKPQPKARRREGERQRVVRGAYDAAGILTSVPNRVLDHSSAVWAGIKRGKTN
jgi:hypothetical protein